MIRPKTELSLTLALLLALGTVATAAEQAGPKTIAGFELQDFRGKQVALADYPSQKVVVVAFLGVECPLVKLYGGRLAEMERKYRDRGVAFIGVNSNQQDSLAKISHFARSNQIDFALLKDPGNKVADLFGAERTPEVFVLDAQRQVRYQGRIDDQYTYGVQRSRVDNNYLVDAIEALLSDKPVETPRTEPVGCHIGRVFVEQQADSAVTYSRQISRILQNRCVECHRPGEIAPFSLTNYEETVGWAEMIAEVVREQRMPPWHASPDHGTFLNDAQLSEEEKKLLFDWVDAGAPEGDPQELPPPRQFETDWRIGKPDLVVDMRDKPFKVPATGEVKYQYFIVDPGFTEDKWVQAAECRPGNRAVVHHIIVAALPPGEGNLRRIGELASDWLAATAPGARPLILREGMAKRIPAGSRLVFQMHYTPIGTPQEDLSSVGLVFADPATVTREVTTQKAANGRFSIPPGDANHRVEASYTFKADSLMLAMFPHMHLRGKAFRYTAIWPDGKEQVLLDVPRYDFNWQNTYELAEPLLMPKGTKIHCVAHFDNSEKNLANPDPTVTVRWGDQTWEEMMIGYFDIAPAQEQPPPTIKGKEGDPSAARPGQTAALSAELKALAQRALDSDEALMEFAQALRSVAPQLDRVCLTSIDQGRLAVERVAQEPAVQRVVGGKEATAPALLTAIGLYSQGTKAQTHAQLADAKPLDLKHMSKALGSSAHVPVRYKGRRATVNFWSRQESAFSADLLPLLEEAARQMASDRG